MIQQNVVKVGMADLNIATEEHSQNDWTWIMCGLNIV